MQCPGVVCAERPKRPGGHHKENTPQSTILQRCNLGSGSRFSAFASGPTLGPKPYLLITYMPLAAPVPIKGLIITRVRDTSYWPTPST